MDYSMQMGRLVGALQRLNAQKSQPDNMLFGEVVSTEPLKVRINNDIILTSDFLYLGQAVRPHKVTIPHTHIMDTYFTEKSPSLGSVGSGMVAGKPWQENWKAQSARPVKYNVYEKKDEGKKTEQEKAEEKKQREDEKKRNKEDVEKEVAIKELGDGGISTSIKVAGEADVVDDSVMITDNQHKHIIPRKETEDVHLKGFDYEKGVIIEIEPKLKAGDTVLMFAFNNFQMFYIAERIEKEEGSSGEKNGADK